MRTKGWQPTMDALWGGTKANLVIYIITETDSDCETLERYDRMTLIHYAAYFQVQQQFGGSILPFEEWVPNRN